MDFQRIEEVLVIRQTTNKSDIRRVLHERLIWLRVAVIALIILVNVIVETTLFPFLKLNGVAQIL